MPPSYKNMFLPQTFKSSYKPGLVYFNKDMQTY